MQDKRIVDAIALIRADAERVGYRSREVSYKFMAALVVDAILWTADLEDPPELFEDVLDKMRKHMETP